MEFIEELRSLRKQMDFDKTFDVPKKVSNVVIAGMGGSGIVAKIFQELCTEMQVHVVDDYEIPNFVGQDTLFIAISYSGNTEETLSALELAKKKHAKVVGITSGGKLAQKVRDCVIVPSGIQPRSALGYMIMPLIRSFEAFSDAEINQAKKMVESVDKDNGEEKSIAKDIAKGRSIPVIYGISPYKSVAYRWKTQFNENSKVIGYSGSFPELNHNDTMALQLTYRKNEFYFMVLCDGSNKAVERRIPITARITNTRFRTVYAQGSSRFARAMNLVHKGDYLTYHLANLINKDPVDVRVIEQLKKELAKK